MKKLLFAVAVSALFSAVPVMADKVLIKADKPEMWKFNRGRVLANEGGVITLTTPCAAVLKDEFAVKIKADKFYTLRGEFRLTGSAKATKPFYLGFTGYTADGTWIARENANRCFPRIFGEVVTTAPKGATEVILKGRLEAWKKRATPRTAPHYRLVCGAKADGSDLPNFVISEGIKANGITKLENGNWKIQFIRPLKYEFAAGSKIAFHYIGATYLFVDRGKKIGSEWTTFYGTYAAKRDGEVLDFYPKQAAAGIAFFTHERNNKIEFRNIEITEED